MPVTHGVIAHLNILIIEVSTLQKYTTYLQLLNPSVLNWDLKSWLKEKDLENLKATI